MNTNKHINIHTYTSIPGMTGAVVVGAEKKEEDDEENPNPIVVTPS
jgi:hypothetical protein